VALNTSSVFIVLYFSDIADYKLRNPVFHTPQSRQPILYEGLRIRVKQVRKNTIFRIWYQNVQQNLLCLVPVSTMLCFARIILQRAKCAIALRTMHELLGADSTMYIGHYLGLLQVGP